MRAGAQTANDPALGSPDQTLQKNPTAWAGRKPRLLLRWGKVGKCQQQQSPAEPKLAPAEPGAEPSLQVLHWPGLSFESVEVSMSRGCLRHTKPPALGLLRSTKAFRYLKTLCGALPCPCQPATASTGSGKRNLAK